MCLLSAIGLYICARKQSTQFLLGTKYQEVAKLGLPNYKCCVHEVKNGGVVSTECNVKYPPVLYISE